MTPALNSPYKLVRVERTIRYKKYGYIHRREVIDDSEYGGSGELEMINCYDINSGLYVGSNREANLLYRKTNIRDIQLYNGHYIGFDYKENKWCGWSHRALCGFGIGDKLFDPSLEVSEDSPFIERGTITIETENQAKLAASRFSAFVA